jgi:hypothetical protein
MQMLRNDGGGGLLTRLANRSKGLVLRGFNKLTGGPFLTELTEFLTIFGSILDALKIASEAVHTMLRVPSTQFLLVTTPARSNVDEVLRFRRELATRDLTFGGFVLNRVHQALPSVTAHPESIAAALGDSPFRDDPLPQRLEIASALLAGLEGHNRLAKMDRTVVDRLARVDGATIFQVPLHAEEIRDLGGLAALARSVTG